MLQQKRSIFVELCCRIRPGGRLRR